ncbi:alginate biosynthesis TPR repeat lipoprotein AlgK [Pseudomonas borbori]
MAVIRTQPTLLLAAAIALGMAGCAGLPDQQLAREAYEAGDIATAERHFRQLAELGYSDAGVGLADIQVASGDPEKMRLAEQTYRAAAVDSPRAQARLGRLLASKPNATEAERREAAQLLEAAMAAGEPSALMPLTMLYVQYPQHWPSMNAQQRVDHWRAQGYPQADLAQILIYRTQGTYAEHLDEIEQICQKGLQQMDVCYVELATVYQMRGQAEQQQALLERLRSSYQFGSVPADRLEKVAQVLADAELGKPNEEAAQGLLELITPNYPAAWVSLARLLYDYPALGDSEKMFEYLKRGQEASQPRADLLLGRLYYEGKWVAQDPEVAEAHLLKATATENSAHYFLGQLYRRGYLGKVYPQKAVDHLLIAARRGQTSADFALAQLYSQGRGIKVNRVNAYAFTKLALKTENPHASELLSVLETQMSAAEKQQAEQVLQRELNDRGLNWQAGQSDLMATEQDNKVQDTL